MRPSPSKTSGQVKGRSDWDGADELQGLDLVLFCYQHLYNLELITSRSQHL